MRPPEFRALLGLAFPETDSDALAGQSVVICSGKPGNAVVAVSDAFEQHTGFSRGETIGRNLDMLQGRDTAPEAVDMFRFLMRTGGAGKIRILNYRKDGTPFWHVCDLRPIRDEAGQITHFLTVQHPVDYPLP